MIVLAVLIDFVRALHQSITVDEADSFLLFVWRSHPMYWFNSPNNHVFNSMLETLFVQIFGPSVLAARLPAMIGALLYITIAVYFCIRYLKHRALALVTFACLTLNPYVQDYLVAARGYSLALAFLMTALYLLARARDCPLRSVRYTTLASMSVGLSIASNFSFGIVGVVTLGIFAIAFAIDRGDRNLARLAVALAIPAPLIAFCICGPALTEFKSSELVYGAKSVGEMLSSIGANSFYGPNAFFVNPQISWLFQLFKFVAPILVFALLAVVFGLICERRLIRKTLATNLVMIAVGTVGLQIIFSYISHTPLPLNRTFVWSAPLVTLILSLGIQSLDITFFTRTTVALLSCVAAFFFLSTRMYFQEWPFNSNTAQIYSVLRNVERSSSSRLTIGTNLTYTSSLNFYQIVDQEAAFPQIDNRVADPSMLPLGRDVYVLTSGQDDAFVKANHLTVICSIPAYEYPDTEIAVRPGVNVSTIWTEPK